MIKIVSKAAVNNIWTIFIACVPDGKSSQKQSNIVYFPWTYQVLGRRRYDEISAYAALIVCEIRNLTASVYQRNLDIYSQKVECLMSSFSSTSTGKSMMSSPE